MASQIVFPSEVRSAKSNTDVPLTGLVSSGILRFIKTDRFFRINGKQPLFVVSGLL